MFRTRALRTLLAVLLVLAQSAAGSFAAQMAAAGAPCAAHAAAAGPSHGHGAQSSHRSGHEHHAKHADDADGDASPRLNLACCTACATGLTAVIVPLATPHWLRRVQVSTMPGLDPGELPGTDPPPRILL
jgi:hypothetical protein